MYLGLPVQGAVVSGAACAVLLSGGLDSVVLTHWLVKQESVRTHAISFDYGQSHKEAELACAKQVCADLHIRHTVLPLHGVFNNSALLGHGEIPDSHASDRKATSPVVVPGRNLLMIATAGVFAVSRGLKSLFVGANADDHDSFDDCREPFRAAMQHTFLEAGAGIEIRFPFLDKPKAQIVEFGESIGVDFSSSYSCYRGGREHCDKCAACHARNDAFRFAGVTDTALHTFGR